MFLNTADELVAELKKKFEQLNLYGNTSGMHRRWRTAYNAYYSNYFQDNLGVGSSGEQGEFATMHINHLRNIIQHIRNLSTQNRLVFDAMSNNSDIQSRNDAVVTNSVLDYYFYEKRFEAQIKAAFEQSLVFGTAFMGVLWDPHQEIYGVDGEGNPVYKGAPKFQPFSPYDVILDPTKDNYSQQNWVVTREIANRWDLMALYPDMAAEIEVLPKISTLQNFLPFWQVDNDSVWLFKAYHKPTPALPKGRYTLFCESDAILDDGDNPYEALPIFCIRPELKYGGAYGHATIFDLLPAQESLNLLNSSIISNQKAFGVQNVVVFKESGVNPAEVSGALNIIEVNLLEGAPNGGLPQTLQLCQTPAEVFKYATDVVSQMEMISGVNSAARGAPPSNLTSGTAIALVATAANTFNSSVESAYTQLCEESASFLVKLLYRFMAYVDVVAISGKNNAYAAKEFKGSDFKGIQRVKITVGNPISKTLSGKVMVADNLLQNQLITNTSEYLEMLTSGTITPILEGPTAQTMYIREENDRLGNGHQVQMIIFDDHQRHIQEHLTLTFRPDVRDNAQIISNVLQHIQEHMDAIETLSVQNPMALAISAGQPIQATPPPPGQQPPAPGQAGPQPSQAEAEGAQTVQSAEQGGPEAVAQSAERRAAKMVEETPQVS